MSKVSNRTMPSKPSKGLVHLLKELRKVLPGDLKKLKFGSYLVADLVRVELRYFCSVWNFEERKKAVEEKSKQCHPNSVAVSIDREGLLRFLNKGKKHQPYGISSTSKVFRTRTISKSKTSQQINVESVGVAVTRAIEACHAYKHRLEEHKTQRNLIEAEQGKQCIALQKQLQAAELKIDKTQSRYKEWVWFTGPKVKEAGLIDVTCFLSDSSDSSDSSNTKLTTCCRIVLEQLSPQQVSLLIPALKEIYGNASQQKDQGTGSS